MASIIGYAGTAFQKQLLSSQGGGSGAGGIANMSTQSVLWSGTAAITSIGLTLNSAGNFVTGSVFTLYGMQ
jgi:hypothetical protein